MKSAAAFHPSEYLRDELEARAWTWREFVDMSGLDYITAHGLIGGAIAITPEYAAQIAAAFGTSPELWLNLQASWDDRNPRVTPNAVIPNETKLHEHLVDLYDAIRDEPGTETRSRIKLREAMHLLSLLYGMDATTRVLDTARMEALL